MVDEKQWYEKFLSEKTSVVLILIALSVFLVSVIVFFVFGNWKFSLQLNEEKIGQFGDFISGVVGTLITLVGIVLYYIALIEQKKDIRINQEAFNLQAKSLQNQIEEFQSQKIDQEQTRKIYEQQLKLYQEQTELIAKQTQLYEQQNRTIKIQQFEASFYSFLNVFLEKKNALNKTVKSGDFFLEKYEALKASVIGSPENSIEWHTLLKEKYDLLFLSNRVDLSHYFKTLYRLFKIIDTGSLSEDEKQYYSKTVRSQLTDYELSIIAYNLHSNYGKKSQYYCLKYDLLKHLKTYMKIEFELGHVIENIRNKNKITFFLDWFSVLISRSLTRVLDMENTQDKVSEFYEDLDIIVEVEIKVNLIIRVYYKKEFLFTDYLTAEENFRRFLLHFLYDKFYFSKFSIPHGDEIIDSKTIFNEQLVHNFEIRAETLRNI